MALAAEVLGAARKPAILVGIGARGAGGLVEQAADVLGAPIIKTLPGKMVVPDDSPYVTGGSGCWVPSRVRSLSRKSTRC